MMFTDQQIKDWRVYERVRKSGRYNMLTHSRQAALAAGLSHDRYIHVLTNYSALKEAAQCKNAN